jgi:superfamily I DNA and/or RNA helicase
MKAMLKQYLYKHYPEYTKEDINDWIERCCGTVHTFQGKQEDEVIFILGCDNKSGTGAAEWAGKKPNLLNVAVTRAKYRIAIIGDSAVWKKVSNFDFAYKVLQKN